MRRVATMLMLCTVVSCRPAGPAPGSQLLSAARAIPEYIAPMNAAETIVAAEKVDIHGDGRGSATSMITPAQLRDSLPRELVEALMGRATQITVGVAADIFPPALFSGAQVLGTRRLGPTTTTVIAFPYGRPQALDTLSARFVSAGFTRPSPPEAQITARGFQNGQGAFSGPGILFCRGAEQFMSAATTRAGPRTVIAVTHIRAQQGGACSPFTGRNFLEQSPIPALAHPSGISARGTGSGGGGDEFYSAARLNDGDSIPETLTHYVDQLKRAGWQPIEQTVGTGVAVATFNVRDDSGVSWFGVFSIVAPDESGRMDLRVSASRR